MFTMVMIVITIFVTTGCAETISHSATVRVFNGSAETIEVSITQSSDAAQYDVGYFPISGGEVQTILSGQRGTWDITWYYTSTPIHTINFPMTNFDIKVGTNYKYDSFISENETKDYTWNSSITE